MSKWKLDIKATMCNIWNISNIGTTSWQTAVKAPQDPTWKLKCVGAMQAAQNEWNQTKKKKML